jgi:hypothetical protein
MVIVLLGNGCLMMRRLPAGAALNALSVGGNG